MPVIVVGVGGSVRARYSESFELAVLGAMSIQRASHVEPDAAGQWWADLSPVGGPDLGPFALRSQALAAENCWLDAHLSQVSVSKDQRSNAGSLTDPASAFDKKEARPPL